MKLAGLDYRRNVVQGIRLILIRGLYERASDFKACIVYFRHSAFNTIQKDDVLSLDLRDSRYALAAFPGRMDSAVGASALCTCEALLLAPSFGVASSTISVFTAIVKSTGSAN